MSVRVSVCLSKNLPRESLRQLLEICTKQAPFRCPQGRLFRQIQGVAMGSPLGPTFANFYMGYLEDNIFSDPTKRPNIYARFIDDVFVQIKDNQQLVNLKKTLSNKILFLSSHMNLM